jgi:20S proteasome alpha/beta subunit
MKRTEKITMTVEELEKLILEALCGVIDPNALGGDIEIRIGGETLQRLDGYDWGVEITIEAEL